SWLHKLSEAGVDAVVEGIEGVETFDAALDDTASGTSGWEALQALIGSAVPRHQPSGQPDPPQSGQAGDAALSSGPQAAADTPAADGGGNRPPNPAQVHRVLAAVERMMAAGDTVTTGEGGASLDGRMVGSGKAPETTASGGIDHGRPEGKASPDMPSPREAPAKVHPLPEGNSRQASATDPLPGTASTPDRPQAAGSRDGLAAHPGTGSRTAHDGQAPPPVQEGPAAEKTRAAAVPPGVVADAEPAAREDTPFANDNGRHTSYPRGDFSSSRENGAPDDQPANAVKSGAAETGKTAAAFPDAARPILADKPAAAAQAPTAGAPDSAAKAFQNAVMDQIVEKASVRAIQDRSEIHIRLKPEFLGHVQMHVTSEKDQIMVRLVTDQPVVKEIIENNLHHLKTELHQHGLTIDKFDVMVNPDANQQHQREPFAQMFRQPPSPNSRRDPGEQDPQHGKRNPDAHKDRGAKDGDRVNYFA
ncbi:MAG TPA: flagellar hook-length control protein FliK, partial [Desulfosarcina sp.]|nr:flagellar hook-length control protein FliK [Desulfosarcina sp.]